MNLLLLLPDEILAVSAATPDATADASSPPTTAAAAAAAGDSAASVFAELCGERARHLLKVLGVEQGSELRAGLLDGPCGVARVEQISASAPTSDPGGDPQDPQDPQATSGPRVRLRFTATEAPPPPLDATLLLALPRPKFLGRILQWATTMGVKQIVLTHSARVEKSYWSSSLLAPEAIRRHLLLGLEQGRDTVLPEVRSVRRFRELCDDVVPGLRRRGDVWIADADAAEALPASVALPATLGVGPEGGWLDHEVARLVAGGARTAHLGRRPLRVEAAVAVVLGRCLPGS
ncbi:MAG: 16S rRNA (uracil(1498)-N(3))-methyltransferase [Acidobacteria bacterium]|nr:MAG: 16S rRNA (uracil(1498)-N(3))-methyltransferase [Acidobacteriota bacterium]REK00333.1 MAG: 16S rRNA (uracil(1498)-N(3))-methyltransferase [Acidobacteriota bacterium]